jgi:hypothetical protein
VVWRLIEGLGPSRDGAAMVVCEVTDYDTMDDAMRRIIIDATSLA